MGAIDHKDYMGSPPSALAANHMPFNQPWHTATKTPVQGRLSKVTRSWISASTPQNTIFSITIDTIRKSTVMIPPERTKSVTLYPAGPMINALT